MDFAAELVVDRPVPNSIDVSVEEHSAFHFTAALFDCRHAVTNLLRKEFVNELLVEAELNDHNPESECSEQGTRKRHKEEKQHTGKRKRDCKIQPAEERIGMFDEFFNVRTFASAFVLHVVRHILARHLFAEATRIALGHIVANMGDFTRHKIGARRLLVNEFLKF